MKPSEMKAEILRQVAVAEGNDGLRDDDGRYVFSVKGGPTYRVRDIARFKRRVELCNGFNERSQCKTIYERGQENVA